MKAIFELEPLLPTLSHALLARADRVTRLASTLEGALPVSTRRALAPTIRTAHTYYSNLIEGHDSSLRDLHDASTGRWATERVRRAVQEEAAAHLAVLRWEDTRWSDPSGASAPPRPTDPEFLAELHRQFYVFMPAEYRSLTVADSARPVDVGPGEWRTEYVKVGGHDAPPAEEIAVLMEHFDTRYRPDRLAPGSEQLIAAAASHHRLLWIHPFRDGNGRIARLYTDAYLRALRLDVNGLWTPTRGFARDRDRYYAMLGGADAMRISSTDGRGARSERRLEEWCAYVLEVCEDQLRFMIDRLAPETLIARITVAIARDEHFAGRREAANAARLAGILVRHGSMTRTDAYAALRMSERTGRNVLTALKRAGWITRVPSTDRRQEPVAIAVPILALPAVIPDLFPTSALDGLERILGIV